MGKGLFLMSEVPRYGVDDANAVGAPRGEGCVSIWALQGLLEIKDTHRPRVLR